MKVQEARIKVCHRCQTPTPLPSPPFLDLIVFFLLLFFLFFSLSFFLHLLHLLPFLSLSFLLLLIDIILPQLFFLFFVLLSFFFQLLVLFLHLRLLLSHLRPPFLLLPCRYSPHPLSELGREQDVKSCLKPSWPLARPLRSRDVLCWQKVDLENSFSESSSQFGTQSSHQHHSQPSPVKQVHPLPLWPSLPVQSAALFQEL